MKTDEKDFIIKSAFIAFIAGMLIGLFAVVS
jgi:hypothetical protein